MSRGISNFQIENAFEKINDEDITDNFVGVFLANRMNKFIKENILLLLQTLIPLTKAAPAGEA